MDAQLEARIREAQVAVVGAMLIDDRCIGPVLAEVGPDDFPAGPYKSTFLCIRKLFTDGKPVDFVTILDAMQGKEGYGKFLRECMDLTPTAANVLEYCQILKRLSRVVKISELAASLMLARELDDAKGLVDQINALMVERHDAVAVSAESAALRFMQRDDGPDERRFLKWGMEQLDSVLRVPSGSFVVLGGYPSAGKTLLSLQFVASMAVERRVGYFSLETDDETLTERFLSHLSQVDYENIQTRRLGDREWAALGEAATRFASMKLDLINAARWTCEDIRSYTLAKRYEIVFVDYLQKIRTSHANRFEAVTMISQELSDMARESGVTVIALAQLTRPEKVKGQQLPPTMASFRESGQIEQDADVGMLLWPADVNDNDSMRILKVAKNKRGRRAKLELEFNGATQTMTPTRASTYRKLQKIAADAKREGRRSEADDTGLEDRAQLQLVELTERDNELPF